jgi:hypothetical protein
MKKPKLSPIFPAHIKPMENRKGHYLAEFSGIGWERVRWTGKRWHFTFGGPLRNQHRRWRGLAEQPKGAA